ncbi:NaeI family type II restriction endonuclease [Sphingomonas bacterium]|uniref:NaeI family type II restriction endonuclease n=1 Tax=Sphingomonas bacterium TaxID=1895847 RepID=UPI001C2D73CF|nr:NaeI family type II restriction endonuclease [Sphingomonas bacterium]
MGGATARLAELFEARQGVPISRNEVRAVASQLDYMKRLRRNGGARDILDRQGIVLLWGVGDSEVIGRLGLGDVGDDEFISYTPKNTEELKMLRDAGHPLSRPRGL